MNDDPTKRPSTGTTSSYAADYDSAFGSAEPAAAPVETGAEEAAERLRDTLEAAKQQAKPLAPEQAEHPLAGPHPLEQWFRRETTPVTYSLIGINVAVYVLMGLSTWGVAFFQPSTQTLLDWGANFAPLTLGGQFWRVLTSAFVHIGLLHIAMNMYCLFDAGRLLERLLGCRKMLAIYLFAGIGGSLLGLLCNPQLFSAGASGAVFGLYGALLVFLRLHKNELPQGAFERCTRIAGAFVGYNLLAGVLLFRHVDNYAHIGGLLTGAFAAWLLIPPIATAARWTLRHTIASIALFCAMATTYGGALLFGFGGNLMKAYNAIESGDYKKAKTIVDAELKSHPTVMAYCLASSVELELGNRNAGFKDAEKVIEMAPTSPLGYTLRGCAYLESADPGAALRDLEKAQQLQPDNALNARLLVWAYLDLGQREKAEQLVDTLRAAKPTDPEISDLNAFLFAEQGNTDAALKEATRMNQTNPKPYHQQLLVTLYKGAGNFDKAREINQSASKDKKEASTYRSTALLELAAGNADGAATWIEKSAQMQPDNVHSHADKALILLAAGKNQEALNSSGQALRLSKDAPHLADYNLVTHTLAARAMHDERKSSELLAQDAPGVVGIKANFDDAKKDMSKVWPHPIVQYLDGDVTEKQLLELVQHDPRKSTEVRTYVAMRELANGDKAAARANLDWVAKSGIPAFSEFAVARYLQQRRL